MRDTYGYCSLESASCSQGAESIWLHNAGIEQIDYAVNKLMILLAPKNNKDITHRNAGITLLQNPKATCSPKPRPDIMLDFGLRKGHNWLGKPMPE